jgi:PLP dependent protein
MSVETQKYREIMGEIGGRVALVAVSKTKPIGDILELHQAGQRDFGENYVQEMADKQTQLPPDIRWHFIGHLQSNKVKYIAPFVYLIQGIDSLKLLVEINKQAIKNERVINCLLQVHIAMEETKFGFDEIELTNTLNESRLAELNNVRICGLMGMASFTDDSERVRSEYSHLKSLFDKCSKLPIFNAPGAIPRPLTILSMGMSSDYKIAIAEGSTMVRIGSLIFGERNPV